MPNMNESKTGKVEKRRYSLNRIYFYLTGGCNLCCRHCWILPKYKNGNNSYPSLSLELFRSIIKQAKPLGLSGVKLTGGEPLLHPQIHEIVEEIRTNDLRLVVETNGLLCTESLAEEMAACKNPFVSVSLDGTDAQTHEWMRGVEGSFEAAREGIRNLVKAGFSPQIIMTLTPRNKGQIEDMVHLAEHLRAGSVKFNILQPMARGEQMHKARDILSVEELLELGQWIQNTLSVSTGVRLYYSSPLVFRPLSKMFGDNGDDCGVCGILRILGVLADGSYALCGIGETVPELVFGHAEIDRLEEVWNNTPVLQELREGLPNRLEATCAECLMRHICLGNCIAENYYRSKSLWKPFWFCKEAYAQGLFPETRLLPKKVELKA